MNKKQVYILGDMLKKGSVLLRQYEADVFRALEMPLYSAIEQKDINDKNAVTEEQNNCLEEEIWRIFTDGKGPLLIVAHKDYKKDEPTNRVYRIEKGWDDYITVTDLNYNMIYGDKFLYKVLDHILYPTEVSVMLFSGGEYEPDRT